MQGGHSVNNLDIQLVERLLAKALQKHQSAYQIPFPENFDFHIIDNQNFGACVREANHGFEITINSATLSQIKTLWDELWSSPILSEDGKRIANSDGATLALDQLKEHSITWLVLHEMMHIQLGHLDLLSVAELIESEDAQMQPIGQTDLNIRLKQELSSEERKWVRACLEMQADSDATELLLGVYSNEEQGDFRIKAAAIFVVMALMEKATNQQSGGSKIYPDVATRFFMLFAQLFQYWMYSGATLEAGEGESFVRPENQSDGEAFIGYANAVLRPIINDAIDIAHMAGIPAFLEGIGGEGVLFQDIHEIQYAKDLSAADLQSAASQEWRRLLPINEKIMALLALRETDA